MNKLPKGWNFTIVDDNADLSNSENIQGKDQEGQELVYKGVTGLLNYPRQYSLNKN